jgi:hypothetical protein
MGATVRVNTNGSGAGSGTTDIGTRGTLRGIKIALTGVHTATGVTITEATGLGRTLLAVTGLNASAVYHPEAPVSKSDGVAITDATRPFYFSGTTFTVAVTGGPNNATNAVQVFLNIDPGGSL